jgi:hypothetical protein
MKKGKIVWRGHQAEPNLEEGIKHLCDNDTLSALLQRKKL